MTACEFFTLCKPPEGQTPTGGMTMEQTRKLIELVENKSNG